ncbi:hypothetical protein SAMN05421823_10517 [Catalinimonas alkaloidigena]|uniref:Uncharacterized protein n=1 Tax=Catalinimonas alkaloidigena TaxID=1075417 RepID=A0A1G9IIX6_9BACT|nr:hypothetical protein [Catalinimonas alkaloidigena]SDL25082.1 hypothetical protein SAMN05421823_10517 [Catalinimonas alkaloidigena]
MTNFVIVHRFHVPDVCSNFEKAVVRKYPQHYGKKIGKYHYLAFQASDAHKVETTLHQVIGSLPSHDHDYVTLYFCEPQAPADITRVVLLGPDQGYRGAGTKSAHDQRLVDLIELDLAETSLAR